MIDLESDEFKSYRYLKNRPATALTDKEKTVLEGYNDQFGDRLSEYDVYQIRVLLYTLRKTLVLYPGDHNRLIKLIENRSEMDDYSLSYNNGENVTRTAGVVCSSMTGPVCSPEFLYQAAKQLYPALETMFEAESIHEAFISCFRIMIFLNILCDDKAYFEERENGVCYTYFQCSLQLPYDYATLFWARCFLIADPERFCRPDEYCDSDTVRFEISPKIPKDYLFPGFDEIKKRRKELNFRIGSFDSTGMVMLKDDTLLVSQRVNGWKKYMRGYLRSLKNAVKRAQNKDFSGVDYPDFPDVVFTVTFKNAVNEETLNRITKAVQKTYGKSRENAPNYDDFEIKGEKEIQVFIDFGECGIKSADKVYKAILNFSEDVEKITVEQ